MYKWCNRWHGTIYSISRENRKKKVLVGIVIVMDLVMINNDIVVQAAEGDDDHDHSIASPSYGHDGFTTKFCIMWCGLKCMC